MTGPTFTGRAKPAQLESVGSIVLAGAYHWTGSPFEQLRPRPLLPVALKPLVSYVLDWLEVGGVPQVTVCANGSTRTMRQHLSANYEGGLAIGYHEDRTPRGAAGCARDAAASDSADTFIVTDGTSIPTVDLAALVARHRATDAALTIVVHERTSTGHRHLEPTGTYVFRRDVFEAVPATSYQDIKENLIPKLYAQGCHIELFTVAEASPRVLSAESYLAVNRWMVQRTIPPASPAPGFPGDVVAHPSAWIADNATLIGPVLIGAGARIHPSAIVVGPTVIGPGTSVGAGAVLTRSVTWSNCTIGEQAFVDQCLLADDAVVEPDSKATGLLRVGLPTPRAWLSGRPAVGKTSPHPEGATVKHALS